MSARRIQYSLAVVLGVILVAMPAAGRSVPATALAPHRAVYDLSLMSRSSASAIVSVRGRMVHEFAGTPCEGYTVSMRWIAQMADSDGDVDVDDIRFASFEESHGKSYSFTSVRRMNDKVIEEVTAHAEQGTPARSGQVTLSKPTDETFDLPAGTVFPTAHLASILGAAMAGEHIAETSVYDVSGDGRKVYQTLAVIGTERHPGEASTGDGGPAGAKLSGFSAWRVTVSYFEGEGKGDETPDFAQSFDLYANGVASELVLDYGDIVIGGVLSDLEFLEAPDCAQEGAPR
jgi:hypothetical protein